jgi:hypothetical protein
MTRRDFGVFLSVTVGSMMAGSMMAGGMMAGSGIIKQKPIDDALNIRRPANAGRHIGNRRLFNFVSGATKLAGREREHLHVCSVCHRMAYVLVRQFI